MNKLLINLFLTSLLFINSCKTDINSNRFTLNGYVKDAEDGVWLYIKKFDGDGYQTIDSVETKNGEFSYQGTLYYPQLFRIYLGNSKEYFSIFIEPGIIKVQTDASHFRNAIIYGSNSHARYQEFVQQIDSINNYYETIIKKKLEGKNQKNNEVIKNEIDSIIAEGTKKQIEFTKDFVRKNNNTTVSLYIMYKYLSNELPINELEQLYQQFDSTLKNTIYGGYIENQLEILKHTEIGQKALDINLPDTTGTNVSMLNQGEKYIIIHFWASWCPSCRSELPSIAQFEANTNYKQLLIYHVSLDFDRHNWCSSIKQFNLKGIHVSDLKGWKNYGAKTYGIRAIPAYILIDPQGKIIFKCSTFKEMKEFINKNNVLN